MARLVLATFLVISGALFAADGGLPSVSFKGGMLLATPSPGHKAQATSIEILETEECSASPASRTSVKVSGKCDFLRAAFSYGHRETKSGKNFRTTVGFTFSGDGPGHILMVSGPFVRAE